MSEELKPCPFCGGDDLEKFSEYTFSGKYRIFYVCNNCLARSPVGDDKELAYKAWNTRPIEDALQAENARLRALTEWQEIDSIPSHEFAHISDDIEDDEDEDEDEFEYPIIIVKIQHCHNKKISYALGAMLEDGFYLHDGGELSYNWDIIAWKPLDAPQIGEK